MLQVYLELFHSREFYCPRVFTYNATALVNMMGARGVSRCFCFEDHRRDVRDLQSAYFGDALMTRLSLSRVHLDLCNFTARKLQAARVHLSFVSFFTVFLFLSLYRSNTQNDAKSAELTGDN